MSLTMPEPDAAVLARRAEIIHDLSAIVLGVVKSAQFQMRVKADEGARTN